MANRYIKSSVNSSEVNDLFASLLICEMIKPGSRFWLISPWISDMEIIDNRFHAFKLFFPNSHGFVRLADVMTYLGKRGTNIRIVTTQRTKSGEGTEYFLERILHLFPDTEIRYDTKLHEKGLLTESFYLSGSMNFTHSGLNINKESIILETDPSKVAEQGCLFSEYWNSLKEGN